MKITTRNMVLGALFLALAFFLPFLTGQSRELGSMLCLMHIPVLLCGFVCGPLVGALVGFVAPLLRSLIFSMPPMMPVGVAMAFELCAYGCLAGLMYRLLPRNVFGIVLALVIAMLGGRAVLGIANYALLGSGYTMNAFLTSAFVTALPGIAIQLVLIPVVVLALRKAKLMPDD